MTTAVDPFWAAETDADVLADWAGRDRHDIAVVLGSGLGAFADALTDAVDVPPDALTHLPAPSVAGHAGRIVSGRIGDTAVLVLAGRVHLYEGYSAAQVCHGVRLAAAAGCGTVVLTNAAGAVNPALPVGHLVSITDHLNLTGASPLTGPTAGPGPRFPDMSNAYSAELRELARDVDPAIAEGVYAALPGPSYETPAEVRMLRTLGADLAGMSTVLETIAAVHLGMRVAAFSLVTNLAAGLAGALDHAEVTAAGAAAAENTVEFLRAFVSRAAG